MHRLALFKPAALALLAITVPAGATQLFIGPTGLLARQRFRHTL